MAVPRNVAAVAARLAVPRNFGLRPRFPAPRLQHAGAGFAGTTKSDERRAPRRWPPARERGGAAHAVGEPGGSYPMSALTLDLVLAAIVAWLGIGIVGLVRP